MSVFQHHDCPECGASVGCDIGSLIAEFVRRTDAAEKQSTEAKASEQVAWQVALEKTRLADKLLGRLQDMLLEREEKA